MATFDEAHAEHTHNVLSHSLTLLSVNFQALKACRFPYASIP